MVTPNLILTPWQEELVRKSGGLISRAQAARTPDPTGVSATNLQYNPSLGTDISGMSGADMLGQFGFGGQAAGVAANKENLRRSNLSEVDRLTEDIQADMAKNPDKYKAMPDSEAREQAQRQSIESLQAQIAANVAEQQRQAAQQQKAAFAQIQADLAARREQVGDPTVVSSDPMTYQDEYDAARQPLPEGTDPWDQAAANVSFAQRQAREINETYGPLLQQLGLGPITDLTQFLELVRSERDDLGPGSMGTLGMIYTDYFDGRDQWGIFGEPQILDPNFNPSPITDPTTLGGIYTSPDDPYGGAPFVRDIFGYGDPYAGMQLAPGQGQVQQAGLLLPLVMAGLAGFAAGNTPFGGSLFGREPSGEPNRDWRDTTTIHPPTPGDTMLPSGTQPISDNGSNIEFVDTPEARDKYLEIANQLWNQGTIPQDAITELQNISFQTSAAQTGVAQTVTFTVQDQIESLQKLLQTFNANRAEIQQGQLRAETLASTQLAQDLESKRYWQDKRNADRDFELIKRRLEFDIVNAQETGRQVDQRLLFDYRQAAQNANQANRSLELQRYQTDVTNPFNVAAMNLLSGPPQMRVATSAQQSGVTQSALNSALQAAQHHAGRQGIGIDDPQIQQMARQLVNQIDDPVQKAAMNAIAQGVSNLSVTPTTQPTTGPSQNIFMDALQQRQGQAQTVPFLPSVPAMPGQMSGTQTFVPQGLRDIGFQVPSDVQAGQASPFSRFFPGGMPTLGDLSDLSTIERKTAEAVGATTGTTPEDIIQQSSAITPRSISAGTQPVTQTQRLRQPYDQRSGFYSSGGRR